MGVAGGRDAWDERRGISATEVGTDDGTAKTVPFPAPPVHIAGHSDSFRNARNSDTFG